MGFIQAGAFERPFFFFPGEFGQGGTISGFHADKIWFISGSGLRLRLW